MSEPQSKNARQFMVVVVLLTLLAFTTISTFADFERAVSVERYSVIKVESNRKEPRPRSLLFFLCNREQNNYKGGYFAPYLAEALQTELRLVYLGDMELSEARQMYFESLRSESTIKVLMHPRSTNTCYKKYSEIFLDSLKRRADSLAFNHTVKWGDEWRKEVFWPKDLPLAPIKRHSRPFIIYGTGEVFDRHGPRPEMDMVLYSAREPIGQTLTGHIVQAWYYHQSFNDKHFNFTKLLVHPNRLNNGTHLLNVRGRQEYDNEFRRLLKEKRGVAAIMNRGIIKPVHFMDPVIRWTVCSMLNDIEKGMCHDIGRMAKPTSMLNHSLIRGMTCKASQSDTYYISGYPCYSPYKFSIVFENTVVEGYLSEKLFNAKLANTIPVYLGATDIEKYVNVDAIVRCDFSPSKLKELRGLKRGNTLRFPEIEEWASREYSNYNARNIDEYAVLYTKMMFGKELESCIKEIVRLNQNDAEYLRKLKMPLFRRNTWKRSRFDGFELAQGIADAVTILSKISSDSIQT